MRADVQAQFEFKEIDIAAAGNEAWLQAYQYDIPVIHLNGSEVQFHRAQSSLDSAWRAFQSMRILFLFADLST
jgi:hypothetical protein